MKRLLVILVALATVAMVGTGCRKSAHDRYREWNYRRTVDADLLGIQDDFDAVFLAERPTHLSPWRHP